MKLIGIGRNKWVNAEKIEAITYGTTQTCTVWVNGGNYVADCPADALVDVLEAHGVEIVPLQRPESKAVA